LLPRDACLIVDLGERLCGKSSSTAFHLSRIIRTGSETRSDQPWRTRTAEVGADRRHGHRSVSGMAFLRSRDAPTTNRSEVGSIFDKIIGLYMLPPQRCAEIRQVGQATESAVPFLAGISAEFASRIIEPSGLFLGALHTRPDCALSKTCRSWLRETRSMKGRRGIR
jgi:hypothetical protein